MTQQIATHAEFLDFYRHHTEISNPGAHEAQCAKLPTDVRSIADILHGAIIHMWWIYEDTYGFTREDLMTSGRDILAEISLRTVEQMISKILDLDPRPLGQKRDAQLRLVGNCRDYALMLTSILRSQGIPARVRTGVATYFVPDARQLEDHWICEFWNSEQKRWQQTDAQLDEVMLKATKLPFDPIDLPPSVFLTGWQCYQELTSGQIEPAEIGFRGGFNGMRYVRNKLFADLASVTGQEVLSWASWGLGGDIEGDNAETIAGDDALTEQIADILKRIDEPAALQEALGLMESHPRLKKPQGYSAGQFKKEWLSV